MITIPKLRNILPLFLQIYDNIEARDFEGNTLLHIAMQRGIKDVATFLLHNDANVDAQNSRKESILHVDTIMDVDLLNFILPKMTNIFSVNIFGNTCLHRNIPNISYLEVLLAIVPNIDIRNNAGATAVFYQRTHLGIDAFLRAGADLSLCDGKGRSMIHYPHDIDALDFLLQSGLDPNQVDNEGRSAIGTIYHSKEENAMELITGLDSLNAPVDALTIFDAMMDYVHNRLEMSLPLFILKPELLTREIVMNIPGQYISGDMNSAGYQDSSCSVAVAFFRYFSKDLTRFLQNFYPMVREALINRIVDAAKSSTYQLACDQLYRILKENPNSEYLRSILLQATCELNEDAESVVDLKLLKTLIDEERGKNLHPSKSLIVLSIDYDASENVMMELLKILPIRKEMINYLFDLVSKAKKAFPVDQNRVDTLLKVIAICLEKELTMYRDNRHEFLKLIGNDLSLFGVMVKAEEMTRTKKVLFYNERDHDFLWQDAIGHSVEKTLLLLKSSLPTLILHKTRDQHSYLSDVYFWAFEIESDVLMKAVQVRNPDFTTVKKSIKELIEKNQWGKIGFLSRHGIFLPEDEFEKMISENKFGVATQLLELGYIYPIHRQNAKEIFNQAITAVEVDEEERVAFLVAFFRDYPYIVDVINVEPLVNLKGNIEILVRSMEKHRNLSTEQIVPMDKDANIFDVLTLLNKFDTLCLSVARGLTEYELAASLERLTRRKVFSTDKLIEIFCQLRPEHMKEGMVSLNEPVVVIPFPEIKKRLEALTQEIMRSFDQLIGLIDRNTLVDYNPANQKVYFEEGKLKPEYANIFKKFLQLDYKKLFQELIELIKHHPDRMRALNSFLDLSKTKHHYKLDMFLLHHDLSSDFPTNLLKTNHGLDITAQHLIEICKECVGDWFDSIDLIEKNEYPQCNPAKKAQFGTVEDGKLKELKPRYVQFCDHTNFQEVLQDILVLLEQHPKKACIGDFLAELMKKQNQNKFDLHQIKMEILTSLYDYFFPIVFDAGNPHRILEKELRNDDYTGTEVPTTIAHLSSGYKKVLKYTKKRKPYTATPPSDTAEIEFFYNILERNLVDIIKKVLREPTPSNINYSMTQMGIAGLHCAWRWLGNSNLVLRFMCPVHLGPKEMLLEDMRCKRRQMIFNFDPKRGSEVHYRTQVVALVGEELGFEEAKSLAQLNDNFKSPSITKAILLKYFEPKYGFNDQLSLVKDFLNHLYKDGVGRECMANWIAQELYPRELVPTEEGQFHTFYNALVFDENAKQFRMGFILYMMLKTGVLSRK